MKAGREFPPDLILEQYALGELYGPENARVESLLAADPALRERLAALRRSDADILEEAPPAEIAASIKRRMLTFALGPSSGGASALGPSSGAMARRFRPAAAFAFPAAAAVLVLFGAVMAKGILFPAQSDALRSKSGAPGLFVYKKSLSGPQALSDGAAAATGDILQIKYAAGSESYGAIASLDGRGTLTWHLPAGPSVAPGAAAARAPRIEEAGAALASAYELDDAPSFERFFIFSSKDSFDLSLVAAALHDLARSGRADTGSLSLPAGLLYKSLLLRKAPR